MEVTNEAERPQLSLDHLPETLPFFFVPEFRASRAPTWLSCARRAGAEERAPRKTTPQLAKPVATEFGDRLHNRVTGHEATRQPRSIAFDQHTRTGKELDRQIQAAALEVADFLNQGEVVAREDHIEAAFNVRVADVHVRVKVSGHVDLVFRHHDGRLMRLDLKTSRQRPQVAWSQLCIYEALARAKGQEPAQSIGVLWAPRGHVSTAEPILRDAGEAQAEGHNIIRARAAAAVFGEQASPSREGCAICKVENCTLRA